MQMRYAVKAAWRRLLSGAAVPLLLVACAAPAPVARDKALPFEAGVHAAVDDLFAQTQTLPPLLAKVNAKLNRSSVLLDTVIDAATGQQTVITRQSESYVQDWVGRQHAQFEMLPMRAANVAGAQYLLTGALQKEAAANGGLSRIHLALIDLKAKQVVAQATVRVIDIGADISPTPYYRDSPVLMRDDSVDGHVKLSQSAPGSAADARYLDRLLTSALLNEAIVTYDADKYSEAQKLYKAAAARPDGQQMRVFTGLYLANVKLGRAADAEQAFGKMVGAGLSANSLGVKFLFRPGSTDFWPDPKVSGAYEFWLRQIAKQALAIGSCMDIVGHTSRTGSEEFNNRLSLQRAAFIRSRLETDAPGLKKRLRESGIGFRQNIMGTGTDDVRDALDRRVEFKVTPCEKLNGDNG